MSSTEQSTKGPACENVGASQGDSARNSLGMRSTLSHDRVVGLLMTLK
jgi:hypothetical protein